MARIPFADLPIHTWMPMQDGQPYLAIIAHSSLIFKGPSPLAAHRAADEWRKAERAQENTQRRADAVRAAHAARKAGAA